MGENGETDAEERLPAAGALNRPLFTAASQVGDLVFMYDKGGVSLANRAYQNLARGASRGNRALYSHVAIIAGHGMLIHADSEITRYELMAKVVPRGRPLKDFRIVRRSPSLTEAEQRKLLAAVGKHEGQDYTLGFGPFAFVRKIAAGQQEVTLPFCSELATIGYRAIGGPLAAPRPANEVLPLDLDLATRGEGWVEVTDQYYPEPILTTFPDGTPTNMPPFPDLGWLALMDLHLVETRRQGFDALVAILDFSEKARRSIFERASLIHHNAAAMIAADAEEAARCVGGINDVYQWVLTETDGPFTQVDGRQSRPADVAEVLPALAALRGTTPEVLRTALLDNLRTLVSP